MQQKLFTYNISIYNEGDKAGRATKIVDQLPDGLKFVKVITTGFTGTVDSSNKVTITRDSNNSTNLAAYSNGKLESETIQLECEVTATASGAGDKILTNVAWISEEYDAVDKVTITNQTGKDRDSEPIQNLKQYLK